METEKLLRKCGFSARYLGYYMLLACILIAAEDESRLLNMTSIYRDAARMHCTATSSVERNIRTVISRVWDNGGQKELERLCGCRLYQKPTVGEVIEIFVCYLNDHCE